EVERRRPGSAPEEEPAPWTAEGPPATVPALHVAVEPLDADLLRSLGHDLRSACRAVYSRALARGVGSFWLDSARTDVGTARWSVLGDAVDVLPDGRPRVLRADRADPADHAADLWEALAAAAAPRPVHGGEGLAFRGGLVGFLGYEAGLAGLGVAPPRSGGPEGLPDAWWVRPARWAAADHATGTLHVCVAGEDPDDAARALDAWLAAVRAALAVTVTASPADRRTGADDAAEAPGMWRHDRAGYRDLVRRCQAALTAGESYELCLTSRFDVDPGVGERVDPLALFLELTERTPTPYAALLEVAAGPGETDAEGGFAVVSASPEQFLSGADGVYSTKPIKGTTP
ncbi:chorismate-binding protein, partial [uncultured Micrococcus sp.]|uniref:chorismate-binding protein n=1 Tax=uncultured Micrococcus sp. TaxID=114051 RepID=UPI00345BCE19